MFREIRSAKICGFVGVSLLIMIFLCRSSYAKMDFGFQPRIEVGEMHYTLEIEPSSSIMNSNYHFSDTMPYVTVGSSFFLNRFYLDLKFQQSAEGSDQYSNTVYLNNATNTIVDMNGHLNFEKQDLSITVGYSFKNNISIFAGYKKSSTDLEQNGFAEINLTDDGSITGTSGTDITIHEIGNINFDFETDGPFIGASYGYIVKDKGALTLSVGVAFLDSKLNQSGDYVDAQTGDGSILGGFNLETSGDTIGISYNVGWKGVLTQRIRYFISFGGYKYEFDSDENNRSDMTETMYYGGIGLSYSF